MEIFLGIIIILWALSWFMLFRIQWIQKVNRYIFDKGMKFIKSHKISSLYQDTAIKDYNKKMRVFMDCYKKFSVNKLLWQVWIWDKDYALKEFYNEIKNDTV